MPSGCDGQAQKAAKHSFVSLRDVIERLEPKLKKTIK
jgi:hypothetical protein